MSKRRALAKWSLPIDITPGSSTCWLVPVPDDPFHKAAFLGALQSLGSASKWQDDPDHKAVDAAKVWRGIADGLTECPPVIMFQNPDPCTLQVSFDSGDTWTTIYDDGDCEDANPAQPGATSGVAAGDCPEYSFDLYSAGQWFVPFSLDDRDTVEILEAVGIWNDSTSQLFCPDGKTYSAGACSGGPGYNALDPVPAAHHMTAVLMWGSGGVPMENTAMIPDGTGAVDAWIQANDAVLGDNFGQIHLKVKICKYLAVDPSHQQLWFGRSDSTPTVYPQDADGYYTVVSAYSAGAASHVIDVQGMPPGYVAPGTRRCFALDMIQVSGATVDYIDSYFCEVGSGNRHDATITAANGVDGCFWYEFIAATGGQFTLKIRARAAFDEYCALSST